MQYHLLLYVFLYRYSLLGVSSGWEKNLEENLAIDNNRKKKNEKEKKSKLSLQPNTIDFNLSFVPSTAVLLLNKHRQNSLFLYMVR